MTPGAVVEKVVCRETPSQSYALYVPSVYLPEKKWPVLYAFDARGRAVIPLGLFRDAAEKRGWVVASVYGSASDGPMEPNIAAMKAVLADTREKLSLDERRMVFAGFSGLARFATVMGYGMKGGLFGVIGAAAGFAAELPARKDMPFVWFGLVGEQDFNYDEMRELDGELARLGLSHRLLVFPGRHTWPPAGSCAEALQWMELMAVKRGLAPVDEVFLEESFRQGREEALKLESSGDRLEAFRRWSALEADFSGLRDVAEALRRATALRASKDVQKGLKEEESRREADRRFLAGAETILQSAVRGVDPVPLARLVRELGIPDLEKRARAHDREDALSAKRLLEALHARTSLYLPHELRARGDERGAALCLAVAERIRSGP